MFSAALYARVHPLLCTLHTRPRVQRAPGIPCALCFIEGEKFRQSSGAMRREKRKRISLSSLREAKQSILRDAMTEEKPRRSWMPACAGGMTAQSTTATLPPPRSIPPHRATACRDVRGGKTRDGRFGGAGVLWRHRDDLGLDRGEPRTQQFHRRPRRPGIVRHAQRAQRALVFRESFASAARFLSSNR